MTSVSRDDLAQACLKAIERHGWTHLTLYHVADVGNLPLEGIHEHATDKIHFLPIIGDYIESQTEEVSLPSDQEKHDTVSSSQDSDLNTDLIFEVFMARFDALEPHKKSIQRLLDDLKSNPKELYHLIPDFLHRYKMLLNKAGISYTGPLAPLQLRASALAYLKILKTFLEDDSQDLAKTMAECDQITKTAIPIVSDPSKICSLFS